MGVATHRGAKFTPLTLGLALLIPIAAALAGGREDQLKAAYLFNFVKFVEWPAGAADQMLTVCFVGGEGVREALAASTENKKIGNRALSVRLVEPGENLADCSALYIEADKVSGDWRSRLGGASSLLTVSDAPLFTRNGGMIGLFTDSNRLRFNINVDNAGKAGLRISSSLLQLAASVEKTGAP